MAVLAEDGDGDAAITVGGAKRPRRMTRLTKDKMIESGWSGMGGTFTSEGGWCCLNNNKSDYVASPLLAPHAVIGMYLIYLATHD